MKNEPHPVVERISDIIGSLVFGATVITLIAALPAAGAWYLGAMAYHAVALSGIGIQVAAAGAGGILGLAAGLLPLAAVNKIGTKKSGRSYGPTEIMCIPAEIVGETINCIFSPRYGFQKLKSIFSKSARKSARTEKTSAPAQKLKSNMPFSEN
ncbi:MAG: hypothetical protein K8R48_08205 [Alphaproteobacteria bacterium]|nr:hypothetical protein [Alphaproteobacteria bacterium]